MASVPPSERLVFFKEPPCCAGTVATVIWCVIFSGLLSPLIAQKMPTPALVAEQGGYVRQLDDGFEIDGQRGWLRLNAGAAESGRRQSVVMPVLKRQVKPRYPRDMLARAIPGVVVLEVVISRTGPVDAARVTKSASEDFDAAPMGAAKQWQFAPATLNGEPISIIATIELSFKL